MTLGTIRIAFIFINNVVMTFSGSYKMPYQRSFSSSATFPVSLASFSSWFETTNIVCGIRFMDFTSLFYDYTTTYQGNAITFTFTIAPSTWGSIYCIIAGPRICPLSNPYYDSSTGLCYDTCTGQNTNNYLCTPAYTCPSNCKYCSSNTVCTVCSDTYYKRSDNLCYSSCLAGTFPNTTTMTCDQCQAGCNTCSSGVVCMMCYSGYNLRADYLC